MNMLAENLAQRTDTDAAPDLRNESDYNVQRRHPERTEIYAGYARRSEALRADVPWQSLRYDKPERCTLDWFPAEHPAGAPLLIFMHGGFWRGGDKRVFSFIAENLRTAGISSAFIGYELAPAVTVTTIAAQIRSAVTFLLRNQRALGFDPERVTLSGHSAGAQLAAMTSAYPQEMPILGRHLRVIGVSGVYQLPPLLATTLKDEIQLTPEVAAEQSLPEGRWLHASCYLLVVGGGETPGFLTQSTHFHDALRQRGLNTNLIIEPGRTHFDIFVPLTEPTHALHEQVLEVITQ
ncbi:alpha/beta hydrolase [Bordetella sp. LUAb4]|uniref:alpha/beta hydrolase n=1 Tax=Bordetella sp. LUAb4 TaxID=2843195 RepID=UPI001E540660|nr:alpha/beta hydrolase [Bordetella sp. LUAb4]